MSAMADAKPFLAADVDRGEVTLTQACLTAMPPSSGAAGAPGGSLDNRVLRYLITFNLQHLKVAVGALEQVARNVVLFHVKLGQFP